MKWFGYIFFILILNVGNYATRYYRFEYDFLRDLNDKYSIVILLLNLIYSLLLFRKNKLQEIIFKVFFSLLIPLIAFAWFTVGLFTICEKTEICGNIGIFSSESNLAILLFISTFSYSLFSVIVWEILVKYGDFWVYRITSIIIDRTGLKKRK